MHPGHPTASRPVPRSGHAPVSSTMRGPTRSTWRSATAPSTAHSTGVYVTTSGGIAGLHLTLGTGGVPRLQPVWQKAGDTVASPLVADNVLYDAVGTSVIAYNPLDGGVLWQNPAPLGGFHWESP